jgi:hypothetical protein
MNTLQARLSERPDFGDGAPAMEATPAVGKLFEFLVALLTIGLPGLPPGERDPHLLHAIPADALVAFEWSAQGSGVADATGLEGLLAEPEVQSARRRLQALLLGTEPQAAADRSTAHKLIELAQVCLSRPGCLYIAAATKGSPERDGRAPLRAGLVIQAGRQADAILAHLQRVLPSPFLEEGTGAPKRDSLFGIVQFRRQGTTLAWGFGPGAADEALARLTSQQGGLASVPEFTQRYEAAMVERPGSVLWLHVPALLEQVVQAVPRLSELKDRLPVAPSGSLVLVSGLDLGRVVTRAHYGESPGVITALTPAALQNVPADAHVVLSGRFDLSGAEEFLKTGVGAFDPTMQAGFLQLRQALSSSKSADLSREVFDLFGSQWTLYSAPSTGGPFGIGPVLSWELQQPERFDVEFHDVMAEWTRQLLPHTDRGESLAQEIFQGRTIYTHHTPEHAQRGLAPSWCVAGRFLVLALQPQPLRSHLRFLDSDQPRFAQWLDKTVTLPPRATLFGFVDAPALNQVVWPLLPFAMARLQPGLVAMPPSVMAIQPHLAPMRFSVQARDDGWLVEVRNPLSLAAPLLAGVALYEATKAPSPTVIEGSPTPSLGVELGAPEGGESTSSPVTPAVATEEKPPGDAARKLAPSLIRAFTPDDVEWFIPAEVFRRLEQGPTPEQQQRRRERLEKRAKGKSTVP